MLQRDYNDKDAIGEHLLTKYLVSAVLLGVTFFAGLRIMNDMVAEAELLSYEIKQERLERALAFVHQHWNQRGQPSKLSLTLQFQDGKTLKQVIHVSDQGWPTNVGRAEPGLDCDNLWRYLVLEQNNEPLAHEGIEVGQTRHTCLFAKQFDNNRTWKVEYNTENGRLTN